MVFGESAIYPEFYVYRKLCRRSYWKAGRQILRSHANNLGLRANDCEGTPLVDLGQRAPPQQASNPAMTGRSDWIQILGYSWLLMLAAGVIVAVVLLS
jgi:hypothetical protein